MALRFGETALLKSDATRNADASTLSMCRCLVLARHNLTSLLALAPALKDIFLANRKMHQLANDNLQRTQVVADHLTRADAATPGGGGGPVAGIGGGLPRLPLRLRSPRVDCVAVRRRAEGGGAAALPAAPAAGEGRLAGGRRRRRRRRRRQRTRREAAERRRRR